MILVSFCRILNGLSNEINLFWRCSSPLRSRIKSLRNAKASLHEVPFKLPPEEEACTVLSSSLGLFLQYSGWMMAYSEAH